MTILGIDEVGRGPLAGPLVVGAVILPVERPEWIEGLKDSKKLTAKMREKLSAVIWAEAPAVGLGWVSPKELDELGVTGALRLATRRAVKVVQGLGTKFTEVVIDGKINFLAGTALERFATTVVKADDLIKEVSAASIVAKVARDKYMMEAGERFPGYGFEKNVGYGTAMHMRAIREKGITPEHRLSYEPCKSIVGYERVARAQKNTTAAGGRGETAVCEYLVREGHEVLERNFKTYFYEIDIISVKDGVIYFTEVKMRKDDSRGGGVLAVDRKKLEQMKFAAECFMQFRQCELDPLLAMASVNGAYEVEEWMPLV